MPENLFNIAGFPLFDDLRVDTDHLTDENLSAKNINVSVLRLDKIHPIASGNKLFKLFYYLDEAMKTQRRVLTFGGAYSNHLAATAAVCRETGLKSIGIVRGEQAEKISHTLEYCVDAGMQLEFISRGDYKKKDDPAMIKKLSIKYKDPVIIPEGGAGQKGIEGASLILKQIPRNVFTHVCVAVGTGTTIAGLGAIAKNGIRLIGFPAIKGMTTLDYRTMAVITDQQKEKIIIADEYHFGGYAKYNQELLSFMKWLYSTYDIPTDFVYTAKMFYGVFDLLKKNYFPFNSNILCVHTGGLQGNLSLPEGLLNF